MPHDDPAQGDPTQAEAGEDRLYRDPRLAQFYDLENGWGPDFDYCRDLANSATSVLDLGCGTGELSAGLAAQTTQDRIVFGVDPAEAMLDVARQRPGGSLVTWVQADARSLRLDRKFDLVVLTGHAFQVFLTDADQRAVLSTIAAHLAASGRFIFDTRNPVAEAWLTWTPEHSRRHIKAPGIGDVEAWTDASHDATTGIVGYQTHYQPADGGQSLSASSSIRFTSRKQLETMLDDTGLVVDGWLGDWSGTPWEHSSPEIIPNGRLR